MKEQHGLFLRVLLNRAHGNVAEPLLKVLPSEEAKAVQSFSVVEKDPIPLLNQRANTLPKIHYSWICEYLSSLDLNKQNALLACLDDKQRTGICRLINQKPPAPILSPLLKKFYLQRLYPLIAIDARLPIEYLPETPLKSYLNLSKEQLVDIIDLLGLYDLAHELRRIVATKHMKNIYTCLTAKEQQFLRACLHQKDKVVTPSLHLEKWTGDCPSLMKMLHERGIARFAIAVSGQHPDFIWYLTHILDTGRGKMLKKRIKDQEIPSLTSAILLQLESAKRFVLDDMK